MNEISPTDLWAYHSCLDVCQTTSFNRELRLEIGNFVYSQKLNDKKNFRKGQFGIKLLRLATMTRIIKAYNISNRVARYASELDGEKYFKNNQFVITISENPDGFFLV